MESAAEPFFDKDFQSYDNAQEGTAVLKRGSAPYLIGGKLCILLYWIADHGTSSAGVLQGHVGNPL